MVVTVCLILTGSAGLTYTRMYLLPVRPKLTLYVNKGNDACE